MRNDLQKLSLVSLYMNSVPVVLVLNLILISFFFVGVDEGVKKLVGAQQDQQHKAGLDWLTPVDYATQQNIHFHERRKARDSGFLILIRFRNGWWALTKHFSAQAFLEQARLS